MQERKTTDGSGVTTTVSRRRALAAGVGLATGTLAIAHAGSDGARATVDVDGLDVTGDSAELADVPSAIHVDVSGSYHIESATVPRMVQSTLQVHVDGNADDIDVVGHYDQRAGEFDLSADVLAEHRDVSPEDFAPVDPGDTKDTELKIRVIVTASDNGSIIAEDMVEDTATVSVTRDGMEISIGATGSVSVEG